jgi:hypothetical protein
MEGGVTRQTRRPVASPNSQERSRESDASISTSSFLLSLSLPTYAALVPIFAFSHTSIAFMD